MTNVEDQNFRSRLGVLDQEATPATGFVESLESQLFEQAPSSGGELGPNDDSSLSESIDAPVSLLAKRVEIERRPLYRRPQLVAAAAVVVGGSLLVSSLATGGSLDGTDLKPTTVAAMPPTTLDPVRAAIDPESYFLNYASREIALRQSSQAQLQYATNTPGPSSSLDVNKRVIMQNEFTIQPPAVPSVTDDNTFTDPGDNAFVDTGDEATSTFGLDVDTGSYNVADRLIGEGFVPPADSVRVEEFINYFDYDYPAPTDTTMGVSVDGVITPYEDGTDIVRVGVNTEAVDPELRQPAAITMVVDVSGSMDIRERLGLVQASLALLVKQLNPDDTIAVVTYSGDGGILLEPTPVSETETILGAIDRLTPGGGTNLEAGLRTGYRLATDAYRDDAVNIVILASDGVANIGDTGGKSLASKIKEESANGINLVTVGYGMGNFNDTLMEQLADNGDGFYAYLDDYAEAETFFKERLTQTLIPIARDAKVQVEFNPDYVSEYRLIGYENRALDNDDFRDNEVDAGELGSGHSATALYQIRRNDNAPADAKLGEIRVRWETPETGDIVELATNIETSNLVAPADQSPSLRLAHTVAAFAEVLAQHPAAEKRGASLDDLAATVSELAAADPTNRYLSDFKDMTKQATRADVYPYGN